MLTPRLNSDAVLSNDASLINLRTSRAPLIKPIIPFETFVTGPTEMESTDVSRSMLQNVELLLLQSWLCCCARQNMSLQDESPQLKFLRKLDDDAGVERFDGETSFSRPSGGTRFLPLFPFPEEDFRLPNEVFRFETCSPSPSSRLSRPKIQFSLLIGCKKTT